MSFVGVGALCPAAWVVRLFVSLCPACVVGALWGFSRGFCSWVYVYMGSPFPGLVAAFSGLVGTPPRGGLTRGETGRGSTLNILKK